MDAAPEKIQELIRASQIIAYEGYYFTQEEFQGETNAMFRTIIHLLSKAITEEGNRR